MFVNIAAYKFITLDPEMMTGWKAEWKELGRRLGIKGTIILSPEGINLFLAAPANAIEQFWAHLTGITQFVDLQFKESKSDYQPFQHMWIKIKQELVPLGRPDLSISPDMSSRISAADLKRWLDEGRDFWLLDTRNHYEIEIGSFKDADHLSIDTFSDFDRALDNCPPEQRSKPVVIFCTGGIRCEKAAPLMKEKGFPDVYQLDGGILKYFESCGDAHFEGDCFVFDDRIAVDSQLQVSGIVICRKCQQSLKSPNYSQGGFIEPGDCPNCSNA